MNILWPRLSDAVASAIFASLDERGSGLLTFSHPSQIYAPVGGRRASEAELRGVRDSMLEVAALGGFPGQLGRANAVAFDRTAAPVLEAAMPMTWAEASARGVWSFVSLVLMPDVTRWRFGTANAERWIASDLTRHAWARLWWQSVVFRGSFDVLNDLTESDLNQLLERRSIGGDPRLVVSIGRAVLSADSGAVGRRELIRDVTARLRRRLAFLDVRALTDAGVTRMCDALTAESIAFLAGQDVPT